MRVAAEHDLAVVARGARHEARLGAPARAGRPARSTPAGMDAVVEHAAGDLIVVGRARAAGSPSCRPRLAGGRPVAGRRPGRAAAPSAGSSPPPRPARRGCLHGAVRDLLIGATIVRADGVIAHAGGKVVKNVAGYDLGKLLTGSYGTLGVITEVAFRLHPLPPTPDLGQRAGRLGGRRARGRQRVVHSQLAPTAVELDRPADGGWTRVAAARGHRGRGRGPRRAGAGPARDGGDRGRRPAGRGGGASRSARPAPR